MFNRIVSVASQRRSLNWGLGSLRVGPLLISQTLRAGTPTQAQPTDIMSDAAATTPPTETTAGTPMLKWKQGTKEGVCAVTNAAGLREALKAAGAIITEDLDITVKKGPFGADELLSAATLSSTIIGASTHLAAAWCIRWVSRYLLRLTCSRCTYPLPVRYIY